MIQLDDVTIRSGAFSLTGLSFAVPDGAYAVLMGGTGQGKTTILEAICGLRTVVRGRVIVDGQEMTRWKPGDRGVGYVPQDLALFPMMTVRGHLEFALRLRGAKESAVQERTAELASVVQVGAGELKLPL